jgi:hypothetical protein
MIKRAINAQQSQRRNAMIEELFEKLATLSLFHHCMRQKKDEPEENPGDPTPPEIPNLYETLSNITPWTDSRLIIPAWVAYLPISEAWKEEPEHLSALCSRLRLPTEITSLVYSFIPTQAEELSEQTVPTILLAYIQWAKDKQALSLSQLKPLEALRCQALQNNPLKTIHDVFAYNRFINHIIKRLIDVANQTETEMNQVLAHGHITENEQKAAEAAKGFAAQARSAQTTSEAYDAMLQTVRQAIEAVGGLTTEQTINLIESEARRALKDAIIDKRNATEKNDQAMENNTSLPQPECKPKAVARLT